MLLSCVAIFGAAFEFVPEYLSVDTIMSVTWKSNSSLNVSLNIEIQSDGGILALTGDFPLYYNRSDFNVPGKYVDQKAKVELINTKPDNTKEIIAQSPPLIIKAHGSPKAISPDDVVQSQNSTNATSESTSTPSESSDSTIPQLIFSIFYGIICLGFLQ
eukprot:NODE_241_length_11910_cov_1.082381.p11 type:complete len:159 gc:universal NODE_241_length_11910_cov_1.082381:845-1321(+)